MWHFSVNLKWYCRNHFTVWISWWKNCFEMGSSKKNCHLNFQTLSALNSFQGLFVFSCPAVVPQLFIAFLQLSIERKNYFLISSSLADIKQITIPIHLQAAHVRNAHRQHERCSFFSFLYFRSFVKGLTIEVMLMNQLQFTLIVT